MELPSRAPCQVTVVEHGDMVTSEQNPCRFPYSIVRSGPGGQGPFSERSARMAGTFFRKVRENGRRMRGRSGFSFSPHSQDASEKRPCLRGRFGKASLPERTLRKSVPA
jgi:hypothetical protein